MDALSSLNYWYRLLVAFSLVLGVEAPLLLFFATLQRRRWYEQALALLPAGGFALGLYLARVADATLVYWQSYFAFQQESYPSRYWPTFAREQHTELQALLTITQERALLMGLLTFIMLFGGWLLLLRWQPSFRRTAQPVPETEPADAAQVATEAEEQGTLEITVEPIGNETRNRSP
jgi:hypothetical protein